jgi:hypothetical protein
MNCFLFGRVREKVLTGENEDRNHAPSCAGFASGLGQTHAHPDCWIGCWSKWWVSFRHPDWPVNYIRKWKKIELVFEDQSKDGLKTYFFGCVDNYKVFVNLLSFGWHLLWFGILVIFNSQPKFQVLVAVFTE